MTLLSFDVPIKLFGVILETCAMGGWVGTVGFSLTQCMAEAQL